jgi:copper chaperone CopZ
MKKAIIIIIAALMAIPAVSMAAEQSSKKKKAELKEVTFVVDFDCENCAKKIRENVSFEKGVKDLKVTLENKTVALKYDAAKTSEETLKTSIEKLGYPVKGVAAPAQQTEKN